ncbi:MAG: sulfatase [Bacillota bacterium]
MPKKKLPNIILIVLDTARAKSFSCYGYHRKTTPNIDRIAEEGVLYKWCFSPANWTIPSHASLFTGLYPSEHLCYAGNLFLDVNIPTLAELLRSIGYRTIGISCNGLVGKIYGFDRGFDIFHELCVRPNIVNVKPLAGTTITKKVIEVIKLLPARPYLAAKHILRALLMHLRTSMSNSTPYTLRAFKLAQKYVSEYILRDKKPLFLFVNIMQTHERYNPPKRTRGKFGSNGFKYESILLGSTSFYLRDFCPHIPEGHMWEVLTSLYDEELLFADLCVGQLYSFLKLSRVMDNTVFIVTSDHGEMLGEHRLYGHMFSLHNEVIHVPLIVQYPDLKRGEVVHRIVQLHDLFSTICEITEIPYPTPLSSISLFGNNRRKWALVQDLDPLADVLSLKARQPDWDVTTHVPTLWRFPSFAIIKSDLVKIIKPSNGSPFFFDIRTDYNECYPQIVCEESVLQLISDVEKLFNWDSSRYEEEIKRQVDASGNEVSA